MEIDYMQCEKLEAYERMCDLQCNTMLIFNSHRKNMHSLSLKRAH